MRETIDPTLTDDNGTLREEHPAFALASIVRGHGTSRTLFQSDTRHTNTVTLRISHADRTRHLNRDWVHPTNELIEVEMSEAQFGALVSSAGSGSGVPVTLRSEGSNLTPDLPYQPRIAESLDEVEKAVDGALAKVYDTLAELAEAIESKAGVRAVREAMRKHQSAVAHVKANSSFAVTSLSEASEKLVNAAYADIEAHALRAAQNLNIDRSEIATVDTLEISGDQR